MLENNTGHIVGVNGNMLTVEFETAVTQNEVAFAVLGDIRLKAEVIRVRGRRADLQVYENTRRTQNRRHRRVHQRSSQRRARPRTSDTGL